MAPSLDIPIRHGTSVRLPPTTVPTGKHPWHCTGSSFSFEPMGWTPRPRQTMGTCPFWSSCRTGRSVLTCLFGSRGSRPPSLCFSLPSFWKLPRSETCHVSFRRSSPPFPGEISFPWNLNRRCSPDLPPARISTVGARSPSPRWLGSRHVALPLPSHSSHPLSLLLPCAVPISGGSETHPLVSGGEWGGGGLPRPRQKGSSLSVSLTLFVSVWCVWQTHKSRRGR